MSHRLVLDIPEGAFSALRQDPEGFVREMRLADAATSSFRFRVSACRRSSTMPVRSPTS